MIQTSQLQDMRFTWAQSVSCAEEVVVLLDSDVEGRAAGELGVSCPAIEIQPQVAGLEVGAVLASGAAQSKDRDREAIEPSPEELHAERTAAAHAAAGSMRWRREQQEAADVLRVDRKDEAARDALEVSQAARQAAEVTWAVQGD